MLRATMILAVLALAAATPRWSWAEQAADGGEKPKQTYGDPANDMPLDLFRKLKGLLEVTTGNLSPDNPLVSGTGDKRFVKLGPDGKAVELKDLRSLMPQAQKQIEAVAAENKAALLKATFASQALHRELAVRALAYCGDKGAAIPAVGKALAADPDKEVRQAATGTLAQFKDAAGVEPLIKALADQEESIRTRAVSALGAIRDSKAIKPLMELLVKDEKATVRMRCAQVLGQLKDSGTLEGLEKAMENEQDYRVRMAIAVAVRAIRGSDTPATHGVDSSEDHTGELTKLSKEMEEVRDKLRQDRHDQRVQVDQQDIDKKLTALIEKIEKMQQQQQSQSQQQQQKQQQQQQQQSSGKQQGPKAPSSPMTDSGLGEVPSTGAINAAQVTGEHAEWARLPPSLRDEILQAKAEGMPERWRKRVTAYFVSISAEESKK